VEWSEAAWFPDAAAGRGLYFGPPRWLRILKMSRWDRFRLIGPAENVQRAGIQQKHTHLEETKETAAIRNGWTQVTGSATRDEHFRNRGSRLCSSKHPHLKSQFIALTAGRQCPGTGKTHPVEIGKKKTQTGGVWLAARRQKASTGLRWEATAGHIGDGPPAVPAPVDQTAGICFSSDWGSRSWGSPPNAAISRGIAAKPGLRRVVNPA